MSRRFKHVAILSRIGSRGKPPSTFSPSDILPRDEFKTYPSKLEHSSAAQPWEDGELVFGALPEPQVSREASPNPPNVIDNANEQQESELDLTTPNAYDLKPPPPLDAPDNAETLANGFFSVDHLDCILQDKNARPRFEQFLNEYKPEYAASLTLYIASKKAIAAVEYANAFAHQIPTSDGEPPCIAATKDESLDAKSKLIAQELVEEVLPCYLTHRFVGVVTDTLVKNITGTSMPMMKELVPNLAEIFCITDPSLPDNPIVYASQEFYNTTQYRSGYVIGRNCRFLQGPQTSLSSVRRMIEALTAGEELCETVVNYRRDGFPFMNLLMIAPLYDNTGEVKYFLGFQIDVSPLIEGGRGLDSFSRLLWQDRSKFRSKQGAEQDSTKLLGEIGQMLNEAEADSMMSMLRSSGREFGGPTKPQLKRSAGRHVLSVDLGGSERRAMSPLDMWPESELGPSGRLPGVYRKYLLVRPYPSLRITFTSPALRIPGLVQTKFLNRIGGPDHLKESILEAFKQGTGITAKVPWRLAGGINNQNRQYVGNGESKPRWIHCTPLFGSDERVGVWMVILVESEEMTGLLNRQDNQRNNRSSRPNPSRPGTRNEMYAKGHEEEGRPGTSQTTRSARERHKADGCFRDF